MSDVLEMLISREDQEEAREFFSVWLLLPKEDRAVLQLNANAFKVRRDKEKSKNKD